MAKDWIEDLIRRPARYWMDDGIVEIMLGLFFLLVGLAACYQAHPLISLAVLFTSPFLLRSIPAIKRRLTFPRTGYIAARRRGVFVRRVVPVAGAVVPFLVMWLWRAANLSRFDTLLPLTGGVVIGLLFWRAGLSLGLARFCALGCIITAAGTVVALMRLPLRFAFGVLLVVEGSASVVSGLFVLRSYLKAHPQPAGEEQ
jgi:hypothetical protein